MTTISGSRNLKIGIIGAGTIVTNVHLPVLAALGGVDIGWIVDADDSRARAMAKAYSCRPVPMPSNAAELPSADIYLLAAPYGARRLYYDALMQRSAAVYVEKPFAKTLAEHEWICASFAANRIADGYQKRTWGPAAFLTDVVKSGVFGKLIRMQFEVGGPKSTGSRYGGNPLLGGGGILMEIGCHGIDLALFVVSARDLQLRAGRMIAEDGYDLHTDGSFSVDCHDGGTVEFRVVASNLKPTANNLVLEFEQATATFSVFSWRGLRIETRSGSSFTLEPTYPLQPLSPNQNLYSHWAKFLEALNTGEQNHTNAAQSRLTAKALGQLYAVAQ